MSFLSCGRSRYAAVGRGPWRSSRLTLGVPSRTFPRNSPAGRVRRLLHRRAGPKATRSPESSERRGRGMWGSGTRPDAPPSKCAEHRTPSGCGVRRVRFDRERRPDARTTARARQARVREPPSGVDSHHDRGDEHSPATAGNPAMDTPIPRPLLSVPGAGARALPENDIIPRGVAARNGAGGLLLVHRVRPRTARSSDGRSRPARATRSGRLPDGPRAGATRPGAAPRHVRCVG